MNRHTKAVIAATLAICLAIMCVAFAIIAGICLQNAVMQPFSLLFGIASAFTFITANHSAGIARDLHRREMQWRDRKRNLHRLNP